MDNAIELPMDRNTVANIIRAHRAELEALGVTHISLFGSVAREQHTAESDVDLAITLDPERRPKGLAAIGRLMEIEAKLSQALGAPVEVVSEPVRRQHVREAIERDRFFVY